MNQTVWIMKCEWDIGVNEYIFADEDVARSIVAQALVDCDIEESIEELLDNGLLSFEEKEVHAD